MATHRNKDPPNSKRINKLAEEGQAGGRTAAGEQSDIGGNKPGFAPGLGENGRRRGLDHRNRRIRGIDLAVREQSDGAFVA